MWWVVAAAWGAAVALALVVLGFAAYEISWKSARLRRDTARLGERQAELTAVQADLLIAQQRVGAARELLASRRAGSRLEQAARRHPALTVPGQSG